MLWCALPLVFLGAAALLSYYGRGGRDRLVIGLACLAVAALAFLIR